MSARLALPTLLLCLSTSLALAEPLRIDRSQEKMRVDGALNEWRGAQFRELGSGDDARLRFALASVDGGLYVGCEVYDEALVTGDAGDALVLTLALPVERGAEARGPARKHGAEARGSAGARGSDAGLRTSELWFYPGKAGVRAKAAKSVDGQAAKDEPSVQVVEGPLVRGQGYVIEAFVPWTALAGGDRWSEGRAALRFVDVDGKAAATVLRSDPEQRPEQLPKLALGGGQEDMLGSFASEHDLVGLTPRFDFRANVAGDAQLERVVVIAEYVLVYGPGFKNGASYSYNILPFARDGGLRSASMVDLNGDGKSEMLAIGRQQNPLGMRDVWLLLTLEELGMAQVFGIELKKEVKGGLLENSVSITPGKGKQLPRIEQKVGRALGLDATTYREQPATDVQPLLLPWGDVSARSFAWDGKKYALVDEKKRVAAAGAAPTPPAAVAGADVELAPTEAGDRDALVAAFKQQQGLPSNARPTQSVRANVLGGGAPELIDVYGRVLLFTGPDVGAGTGFLSYGAPVTDARDLLGVQAADVTADGLAELLLRVRQPLSGAEGTERELLVVLRADAQGRFARVALVEIARRQGTRAIENKLVTKNGALTIEPGRAQGWTGASYPFADEPTGGAQRLLLPWKDKATPYRFVNGALTP